MHRDSVTFAFSLSWLWHWCAQGLRAALTDTGGWQHQETKFESRNWCRMGASQTHNLSFSNIHYTCSGSLYDGSKPLEDVPCTGMIHPVLWPAYTGSHARLEGLLLCVCYGPSEPKCYWQIHLAVVQSSLQIRLWMLRDGKRVLIIGPIKVIVYGYVLRWVAESFILRTCT